MKELEKKCFKLIRKLLVMASDEFSNHGCNDFDIESYLTKEEIKLVCDIVYNGTDIYVVGEETAELVPFDADDDEHVGGMYQDWCVMSTMATFLAKYVKNESNMVSALQNEVDSLKEERDFLLGEKRLSEYEFKQLEKELELAEWECSSLTEKINKLEHK